MSERRSPQSFQSPESQNTGQRWAAKRQELQRDQITQATVGMESRYSENRDLQLLGSGSQWVVYDYAMHTKEVEGHVDTASSDTKTTTVVKEGLRRKKYVMKFLRPSLPTESIYAVREKRGSRKTLGRVMEVVKRLRKEREFLAEQYEHALPGLLVKEHVFISRMRPEAAEQEPASLFAYETRAQGLEAGPTIAEKQAETYSGLPYDILSIQERLDIDSSDSAMKMSEWIHEFYYNKDSFSEKEIEAIQEQLRTFIDITLDLASHPYSESGKLWPLEDNEQARRRNPVVLDFDYALPDITHLANLVVDRRSDTPTLRLMDTDFVLPPTETIANIEMIYERVLFTILQLEVGVFGKRPQQAIQEIMAAFPPLGQRIESMVRVEELFHWLTDPKRFNTREKILHKEARKAVLHYVNVHKHGYVIPQERRKLLQYAPEWIIPMNDEEDTSQISDNGETTNLPSFGRTADDIPEPPKPPAPATMPLPPKRDYPATVELPAKPNIADTVPLPPKPEIVNESEEE